MKKKCKFILHFALFAIFFFSSFSVCGYSNSRVNSLTERQILTLAALCYYNNVTENVADMLEMDMGNLVDKEEIVDWQGWKIVDYTINDNNKYYGFSAFTFKKGDDVVVAYRGTDGGLLYENWRYFIPFHEHPQAPYCREYIQNLVKKKVVTEDTHLYVTGHSLGGYLSLYAVGFFLQIDNLKACLVKVVTFNGLGLGKYTDPKIMKSLLNVDTSKIVNYKMKGDVVSSIGTHITKLITLSPHKRISPWAAHSILQFFDQDAFTYSRNSDSNVQEITDDSNSVPVKSEDASRNVISA